MAAMPVFVPASAAHRDTAGVAELGSLGVHASRYLCDIGYYVGAQPHGIWRASLAFRVGTLRRGAIDTANDCAGQERQTVNNTYDPHQIPPDLNLYSTGGESSGGAVSRASDLKAGDERTGPRTAQGLHYVRRMRQIEDCRGRGV
jgi:hypothetical protein